MLTDMKIILLGAAGVGKTSIRVRYFDNSWNRQIHKSTIGFELNTKEYEFQGSKYRIAVWDTAGTERYHALIPTMYRDADYAILCFDPSIRESWDKIKFWYDELRKTNDHCKVIICATKKDLLDSNELSYLVDRNEVNRTCSQIEAQLIDVSSKTGYNIHLLFDTIIKDCLDDVNFKNRRERRLQAQHYNNREENLRESIRREDSKCC